MSGKDWRGGQEDGRIYHQVRAEKQKVIREKYDLLQAHLNERGKRLWAASEAVSFGYGGVRAVAEALGMSPRTVIQGQKELREEGSAEGMSEGPAEDGNRPWKANLAWSRRLRRWSIQRREGTR